MFSDCSDLFRRTEPVQYLTQADLEKMKIWYILALIKFYPGNTKEQAIWWLKMVCRKLKYKTTRRNGTELLALHNFKSNTIFLEATIYARVPECGCWSVHTPANTAVSMKISFGHYYMTRLKKIRDLRNQSPVTKSIGSQINALCISTFCTTPANACLGVQSMTQKVNTSQEYFINYSPLHSQQLQFNYNWLRLFKTHQLKISRQTSTFMKIRLLGHRWVLLRSKGWC